MNTDVCTVLTHEAKKSDDATWAALPLLGVVEGLEWRNCPHCHSTLCKEVRQ